MKFFLKWFFFVLQEKIKFKKFGKTDLFKTLGKPWSRQKKEFKELFFFNCWRNWTKKIFNFPKFWGLLRWLWNLSFNIWIPSKCRENFFSNFYPLISFLNPSPPPGFIFKIFICRNFVINFQIPNFFQKKFHHKQAIFYTNSLLLSKQLPCFLFSCHSFRVANI